MARQLSNSKRITITAFYLIVFMAGFALSSSMYSNLLPRMIDSYGFTLLQASYFGISGDIGQMSAMLIALLFLDRSDKNIMIGALLLCYGTAMMLIGLAPALLILLLVRIVQGIAGSLVDNLCATYMADLSGENRNKYVTIVHTFFAVGSMIGPQVAGYFVQSGGGWKSAYTAVGFALGVLALVYLLTMLIIKRPIPVVRNIDDMGKRKKIPLKEMISRRNMQWLCIGSMLLSGGFYLNTWTPTYLQQLDPFTYTISFCTWLSTLAYLGMIISRLLFGILSKRLTAARYLRWSSMLSACLIFLMVWAANQYVWLIGILLYGIVNGSQYTARFLLVFNEFPEFTATGAAVTTIFYAIGNMIFSYIISAVAETFNYTMAMFLPSVLMILSFLVFRVAYKENSSYQHNKATQEPK